MIGGVFSLGRLVVAVLCLVGPALFAAGTTCDPDSDSAVAPAPIAQQAATAEGWCCLGNKLERLPQRMCNATRGRYFDNRQAAEQVCTSLDFHGAGFT
jgi:hypothetical protein